MTIQKAIEKNQKLLDTLKNKTNEIDFENIENQKIFKQYTINVLNDAGYIVFSMLLASFWVIE